MIKEVKVSEVNKEIKTMSKESIYIHIVRVLNDLGDKIKFCDFDGDVITIEGLSFFVCSNSDDGNLRIIGHINEIYPLSEHKGYSSPKNMTFTYYADKYENSRIHLTNWFIMLLKERQDTIRRQVRARVCSGISSSEIFKKNNIIIAGSTEIINNENGELEGGSIKFENTETKKSAELYYCFNETDNIFISDTLRFGFFKGNVISEPKADLSYYSEIIPKQVYEIIKILGAL